jgi:hypothetical protein
MHKFCVCLLEYSSIIITIIIVYLFSIRKGENPAFILNFFKNVRIYTIICVVMLQFLQLHFQ